ncbi:unnamed protein product [Arctogadus glacialis]
MASTAGGAQAQRGAGSGIGAVDGLALYIWAPGTPPSAVRHKSTARYLCSDTRHDLTTSENGRTKNGARHTVYTCHMTGFLVRPGARAGAAGDLEQLCSENFIPQT